MRTDFENWTLSSGDTIRDAIKTIDRGALGIVLVVGDDRLLCGTITDGDVRRAMLAGVSFENPCESLMNEDPITVSRGATEAEVLKRMRDEVIRHLPVVEDGKLIGMHVLQEFADDLAADLPAVVMAGGLGTRLGELTEHTPKPLIQVGGKPILEHIVGHLRSSGITDVFISTRYLAEQIEEHFGEGHEFDVNISYIRERERLGTAGALKYLEGHVDKPFLVMNGDLITDFSVSEMFRFHRERDASLTLAVRHYGMDVPFGVVEAQNGIVSTISEKPTIDFLVNAGIYIVEPKLISFIEEGRMFDITELMDLAIEAGERVAAFPVFEQWIDVGRPEDLEKADQILSESKRG